MRNLRMTALALGLAAAFSVAAADNVLTAVKTTKAPTLDGKGSDAAWAKAKPVVVKLSGGANFKDGATKATLKAVYDGDTLYMLVVYDDPTQSLRRGPYVKQADGSWKKLKDPDDKGGDNNKYYEDKWAMIWNIGHGVKDFENQGCFVSCHAGEAGKPFGNKYLANEGELADMWHFKSVRGGYSLGQVDDQYVDHTRYDKEKAPNAGRKTEPKTGGGYADIKLVEGKPEFMPKSAGNGGKAAKTYWLREEDKVAFDDSKFKAGDEVPSILVSKFTGDRGDVSSVATWKNGKWTVEVARKLVTGSKYDVQFDKLDDTYDFGFAAFDNAQVRHAYHQGALKLRFAR